MAYESKVTGLIIGDHNAAQFANQNLVQGGETRLRGYMPRDYDAHPEGSFAAVSALPIYPRSDWRGMIERNDKEKRWAKDHKQLAGFKSLDQNGTNYCWINAVIASMHYLRAKMGLKHVDLSPASVGAPIKNYRNVGGWGTQGLAYCVEHGPAPQSLWPANAISKKYDTAESREERTKFKVEEFKELPARNYDALVSRLIDGYAIPIGLNWWGHEVCADKVAIQGSDDFLVDIDNSWKYTWGENGHGWLTQSKATPDDACFPHAMPPLAA